MTHNNHRKKGLFILLANKTFELCKELGIRIIYGIPNLNSQHGLHKLGWSTQCIMKYATIDTTPSLLMKLFRKASPFLHNKLADQKIQKLRKNKLSAECQVKKYENGVYRNESYFNYKFSMGIVLLELNSAHILLHINEYNIFLCDFYLKKNKDEKCFWDELISFSKKEYIVFIYMQ